MTFKLEAKSYQLPVGEKLVLRFSLDNHMMPVSHMDSIHGKFWTYFVKENLHSKDISLVHNNKTKVDDKTWITRLDKPGNPDVNLKSFLTEHDLLKTVGPKLDEMDYKQPHQLEKLSRKQLKFVV